MSFRPPSFVSPTSALTDRTSSLPGCAIVHRTTASSAVPTDSVFVRTIGDSIVPSSCTCVDPASLPNALPTKTAPATFSRNRLPLVREDRRDPGSDVLAARDRRVSDAHTGNVGDRVQRPGLPGARLDAQIPRPRPVLGGSPGRHRQRHGAATTSSMPVALAMSIDIDLRPARPYRLLWALISILDPTPGRVQLQT